MQVAFFCCFRQGVAGISRDLGRDVPDLEKLYLKKREGVPEVGTKPLKALRGYRASNRGSNRGSRGSNPGSKGSRKTPEALRG